MKALKSGSTTPEDDRVMNLSNRFDQHAFGALATVSCSDLP
jgi:hypothetical protein